MKKTLLTGALATSLLVFCSYLNAADQSDIEFQEGSVLVICSPPDGKVIATEKFNRAFPQWIELMQKMANGGMIERAHYLGELKDGIFVVVKGNSSAEAMENAIDLSAGLNTIFEKEVGKPTGEMCRFREIGPVAILPR